MNRKFMILGLLKNLKRFEISRLDLKEDFGSDWQMQD